MKRTRATSTGWSAERTLWQELVRLSAHLQWRCVALDLSRSHQVPADDTGVYLLCARPLSGALEEISAYTALYAGQVHGETRSFRKRFVDHIKRPKPQIHAYTSCFYPSVDFWYASVRDSDVTNTLETLLIETLNPPCNAIGAPGSKALLARLGTPVHFDQRTNGSST